MRIGLVPTALVLALTVAPTARAARSEVIASVGMIAPRSVYPSYRWQAEYLLGYGSRGFRNDFEGEVGYLRELTPWLTLGPVARVYVGRMSAPYEGVAPIDTWAGSLAARADIDLFSWPRLFLWADPSLGVGIVGVPDARQTQLFWGFRAGVGIGMARSNPAALRFRIGYGYAPTFGSNVTPLSGQYDWGGLSFQLDGVFRVGE